MFEILFWILAALVIYTYLGYTLLLIFISLLKKKKAISTLNYHPTVTILIAAYNEKDIIQQKIDNLRQLTYNEEKMDFLWVTDGSDDGTPDLLAQYPDMKVLHENKRNGKIGAINRGMKYVGSEIVIFCDANTMLSPGTVEAVVSCFANRKTGCVAGEKKIAAPDKDSATGSGEGIYWYYESYMKKLESEVYSTVGAVGELCAIRTELFEEVEPDALLDDFVISLRIAEKGFKIEYNPQAIATETSSASISDEMKRKIRIAAGCFQTIPRMKALLNPFKYGFFSIQYWSHKVMRWTIVPVAMAIILPLNIYLVVQGNNQIYQYLMALQVTFYLLAFAGYWLRHNKMRLKVLFAPYYLVLMNYCIVLGFFKYIKGKQSVNWEKAKRN